MSTRLVSIHKHIISTTTTTNNRLFVLMFKLPLFTVILLLVLLLLTMTFPRCHCFLPLNQLCEFYFVLNSIGFICVKVKFIRIPNDFVNRSPAFSTVNRYFAYIASSILVSLSKLSLKIVILMRE